MVRGRLLRAQLVRSRDPGAADLFPDIDGSSPEVRALKRDMSCVARDPEVTALIVGESGTGKERVARAIHRASSRAEAPFVVIDCAGLSASLAEDALFGHVRGAFTGAIDDRASPFERAHGGTVLLDEIGDLPLDIQMKLLRALQSRTIQRLGGRQDTPFDVRVIAATNVDLVAARARGRFRDDLYYRLKVYEIRLPPLRSRGAADICSLAGTILARLAQRRRRVTPAIDPDAVGQLVRYPWPGNIRELENTLERMLVAAAGDAILRVRHLPPDFRSEGSAGATGPPRRNRPAPDRIVQALQRNGFRYERTAADLGLSRHQLYRLLKRYGIRPPAGDP